MGIKRTKNQGKLHPLEAEKNSERWLIKHRGISFAESIAEPIKAVNKLSQQKGKIKRQRSRERGRAPAKLMSIQSKSEHVRQISTV